MTKVIQMLHLSNGTHIPTIGELGVMHYNPLCIVTTPEDNHVNIWLESLYVVL